MDNLIEVFCKTHIKKIEENRNELQRIMLRNNFPQDIELLQKYDFLLNQSYILLEKMIDKK